jgi:hypothetical protein
MNNSSYSGLSAKAVPHLWSGLRWAALRCGLFCRLTVPSDHKKDQARCIPQPVIFCFQSGFSDAKDRRHRVAPTGQGTLCMLYLLKTGSAYGTISQSGNLLITSALKINFILHIKDMEIHFRPAIVFIKNILAI